MKETENVNARIEEKSVKWVVVSFVDLRGTHRNISLPASAFLEGTAWEGIDFDGSSVGLSTVDRSDMHLLPDPASAWDDPFTPGTLNLHACIRDGSGRPAGFRDMLENILAQYRERGLEPLLSPEMEFWVFDSMEQAIMDNDTRGTDISMDTKSMLPTMLADGLEHDFPGAKQGYLTGSVRGSFRDFRDELSGLLMDAGYGIRYHHHEVGRRQLEVETDYMPAMRAADYIVNFKYLAKSLGGRKGLAVTFMPKPAAGDAGSGMHFHVMLRSGDANAFSGDDGGLSTLAMQFIAGVLEHARALCTLTNPTINSYRRLVPGFEAPVAIAWSRSNRSALIRVPASARGERNNVEVRNPDTSANPYLASLGILAAGLDGIRREMEAPAEAAGNLYGDNGFPVLPGSLEEAVEATLADDVIVQAVGRELLLKMISGLREDLDRYRRHVPLFDFHRYFDV